MPPPGTNGIAFSFDAEFLPIATPVLHRIHYLIGGVMTPPYEWRVAHRKLNTIYVYSSF